MISSVARRRALPDDAGPWCDRSIGSPNRTVTRCRSEGTFRADGHDLVGADEADRHDRRAGLQSEEGHAGAALVQPPVESSACPRGRARRRCPAREACAAGRERRARPGRRRAEPAIAPIEVKNVARCPPREARAVEVAGFRQEVHRTRGRDGDRDRVDERQVVAREDHRTRHGHVVLALDVRSVDHSRERCDDNRPIA